MRNYLAAIAVAGTALTATAAQAVPALSFLIDGDTFSIPFQITNNSTDGESILKFGIDLAGAGADYCFDIVDGGSCNSSDGVAFTPLSGASVSSATVVDGDSTLDIVFSMFDAGSTFLFDIDVDQVSGPTVDGNEIIGATAYADFSDGQRLLGVFSAVPGNSDASAFGATGIVITPTVPLPASLPLLVAGIGACGFLRRKTSKT